MSFELAAGASPSGPRCGRFVTPHGELETPAFLPVGTHGAVRGITPQELRTVGVQGVLANTYHLHLRPGEELVARLGGVHRFMGWDGPVLTDSGGYQLYSLAHLLRRSEDGVRFRSPIDGTERFLSPESCIAIQEQLGADLICVLDQFEPIESQPGREDRDRDREALERTARWAERARAVHTRSDQLLFGIAQGGGSGELREESARRTVEIGFEAFAIGGLGLGESGERRMELVEATLRPLPPERPRYLMGLGEPGDLVEAIGRGVDLFDCVVPTRNGRHGVAFTADGRRNLRNARYREDDAPLDADCVCPACSGHSRAYIHHLIRGGETLAARLVSLHNLAYYMSLLSEARAAIAEGRYGAWAEAWGRRYRGAESSSGSSDATDSAA